MADMASMAHQLRCFSSPSLFGFPASFPEIDRVVVGADSVSQLAQIVSAANMALQADLPEIHSDDENLINPAKWNQL